MFFFLGHIPLWGGGDREHWQTVVWDTEEVMATIHKYSCVLAVIAGHDHDGVYGIDEKGIHHFTLPGIIERHPNLTDRPAYGTVTVYEDRMEFSQVAEFSSFTVPIVPPTRFVPPNMFEIT